MALLRDSHPLRGDEIGDYLSLRCSSTRSRRLSPWLSSVILTLSVGLLDGPLRWAHSLSLSRRRSRLHPLLNPKVKLLFVVFQSCMSQILHFLSVD
ncbi:hypothetical protein Bca101_003964 [Brassica carinata]